MKISKDSNLSEAFLQAYDEYADAIFRHCYFRVYDRELAKDLMQESFAKAWRYAARGNEVQNLRALLYHIASNLIIDNARKKSSASLEAMQEKGFDPRHIDKETMAERLDARDAVDLLEQLDPKYREVIVMRYIDELAVKEIAEILQESENVISVRIHRALRKLRSLLPENNL